MNIVADHVAQLVRFKQPLSEVLTPQAPIDPELSKKYWRYYTHFPNEFASGLAKALPPGVKFIQYDHLKNQLLVKL